MKKMRSSSYSKKLIHCLSGAILLLTVVFIGAVIFYFRRFDQTLAKENQVRLAETAQQITSHTQTIIQDTQTSLEVAADALSSIEGSGNKISYLSHVRKKPGIAFIGYADRKGTLWTPDMKRRDNISKEPYYINACKGKAVITDVQRKILEDRAVSGIIFSIPVEGEKGLPDGALVAMMDIKKLQDALSISSFNGNGYAYMIDAQGELILRTKSMDYNNYFRVLENNIFDGDYSLEKVKDDIDHNRKGMTLYDHLGTEQYAYYQPLGFHDWTVVNIVGKDAVSANTAVLTKELAMLSVSCVVIFVVLLTTVVVSLAVSKNQQHIAEMKSTFLANMSHEIRTPMNAVTGVSELLLREDLTAKQREYVETIDHSSKSLLVIINDILDYSKIEAGKFTLIEEKYSLRSLMTDITALTVLKIGDKPVQFYVDLDEDLPALLYGDMARVKQIMVNLLSNAVKFTERGYICLHLHGSMENGRFLLTITVEDTGIGIRKQDMNRLFNSFEQIDTHYSHSSGGTGLGLAISKNLAEMMDGSITVDSVYGEGASFSAVICQRPVGEEKLVQLIWPRESVLAVYEPDKDLCALYKKTLKDYQISYRLESDQRKFLKNVVQKRFDFILADQETLSKVKSTCIKGPYKSIVLLRQEEDPYGADEAAVYSPLFCFGLESLLHSGKEDAFDSVEQFNISMIQPIPEAKVLIVDDNKINLGVAEALMAPYQMQIDCVSSGREAVEAVKEYSYDLIFLDHMMPEMDGIETLKAIRSLPDAEKKKIPVIALTANVTKEAQELFKKKGFNDFMPKPIDIQLLDQILTRHLPYNKR